MAATYLTFRSPQEDSLLFEGKKSSRLDELSDGLVNYVRELLIRHGRQFECLDGVRALAFVWVCAYHALVFHLGVDKQFGSKKSNHYDYYRFERPLLNLMSCGQLGVTIFLALSGFLVANTLAKGMRRKGFPIATFYWGRFWRIWPALAVAAFLTQPLALWARGHPVRKWKAHCGGNETLWRFWVDQIDLLVNLKPNPFAVGCWGTTLFWSCALEFQCYLVLPVFLLVSKRSRITAISGGIVFILMVLLLRFIAVSQRYDQVRSFIDEAWYLESMHRDWKVYARPWYRAAEYVTGVLAYFAYLDIVPLQFCKSSEEDMMTRALLSQRPTVSRDGVDAADPDIVFVDDERDSFLDTSSPDLDEDVKRAVAAYDEERWRLTLLSCVECIALGSLVGFGWCRRAAARAAYNHHTHDNFHAYLRSHKLETILTATLEPFFVATMTAASITVMCGGGHHTHIAFRWLRRFLAKSFWYPVASLSFTAYLMSGAAISFLKDRPFLGSDGGFIARYLCLVAFSLLLGFALSFLVERPAMYLSRYLLKALVS